MCWWLESRMYPWRIKNESDFPWTGQVPLISLTVMLKSFFIRIAGSFQYRIPLLAFQSPIDFLLSIIFDLTGGLHSSGHSPCRKWEREVTPPWEEKACSAWIQSLWTVRRVFFSSGSELACILCKKGEIIGLAALLFSGGIPLLEIIFKTALFFCQGR